MITFSKIIKYIVFSILLNLSVFNSFGQKNTKTEELITLLNKYKTENKSDSLIESVFDELYYEYAKNNSEKAIETAHECILYFKNIKNEYYVTKWYDRLGDFFINKGLYSLSLEYYLKSLQNKILYHKNTAWNHVNIGNIYFAQGFDYSRAIKEYNKALASFNKPENLNNRNSMLGKAVIYSNFALIFRNTNKLDSSIFYAQKALKIRLKLNADKEIIYSYLILGNFYQDIENPDSAIFYYTKGINFSKRSNYNVYLNQLKISRALAYSRKKDYNISFKELYNAEKENVGKSYINLFEIYETFSLIYFEKNEFNKSIFYTKIALNYCDSLLMFENKIILYQRITNIYVKLNKVDSAFFYQTKLINLNKLLQNSEIEKMQFNYQIEENEKEAKILSKNIQKLEEKNYIRLLFLIVSGVLFLISILFGLVTFSSRKKAKIANDDLFHSINIISFEKEKIEKVNQQLMEKNVETEIQKEKIEKFLEISKLQKEKIEMVHKEVTDSLEYAKTIQTALLPGDALLLKMFQNYLVFFEPKNVVSGDFYYASKIFNYNVFAVADCTGHGVPGAFLSILAISHLNEILRRGETSTSGGVLTILRERIKGVFKFFGSENSNGLDIALCTINQENNILQYAGAFNPLYIIRNNQIIEYKATRNPIGFYHNEIEFENHEIEIFENDIFYIFTDGFLDQMGGEKDKKFSKTRFKKLLLSISELPLDEQKNIINSTFHNWKNGSEQIDDVTVFAVKWQKPLL